MTRRRTASWLAPLALLCFASGAAFAETEPGEAGAIGSEPEPDGVEVLPARELFAPLLADPREPHFSAVWQRYYDDPELTSVGSGNFGEIFALLGGAMCDGEAAWEVGILGAVFSIFDMGSNGFDLVNSDFWFGPTLSVESGAFTGQARLYHRSAHLGDEFIEGGRGQRRDFGMEGLDLFASAQLHPALRVYLGGGVILNSKPKLKPLSLQAGVEVRSPLAFFDDVLRPVAALDYQSRQEIHWNEELSIAWGFEIANPEARRLRVAVLGTYFTGSSPNGQFFGRRIEYLGVGVHLYF